MADKTKIFTKSGVRTRGYANRRKKVAHRNSGPSTFLTYSPQGLVVKVISGTVVRLVPDAPIPAKKVRTLAERAKVVIAIKKRAERARQRAIESESKISILENPKLDLSNITIITSAQPSRESEIIHQFYTLRNYREFGKKKEDFGAAYERELIDRYEQLNKEKQDSAFEQLEKEFYAL